MSCGIAGDVLCAKLISVPTVHILLIEKTVCGNTYVLILERSHTLVHYVLTLPLTDFLSSVICKESIANNLENICVNYHNISLKNYRVTVKINFIT